MKVIILDNDKSFSNTLQNRLKNAGAECLLFFDANEAWQTIKADPNAIDLLIFSKELGTNPETIDAGLSFANQVRSEKLTADIPFILMSNIWQKNDFAKHQSTSSGANAYFNKKNSLNELDTTIEAVVGFKVVSKTKESETTNTGFLEIKLMAATEVLHGSNTKTIIAAETPINLFPDEPVHNETENKASPQITPSAPPPSLKGITPPPSPQSIDIAHPSFTAEATPPHTVLASKPKKELTSISLTQIAKPSEMLEAESSLPAVTLSEAPNIQESVEQIAIDIPFETEVNPTSNDSTVQSASLETSSVVPNIEQAPIEIISAQPSSAEPVPTEAVSTEPVTTEPVLTKAVPPEVVPNEPVLSKAVSEENIQEKTQEINITDEEVASDLPYLFTGPNSQSPTKTQSYLNDRTAHFKIQTAATFTTNDDLDTLKKYLTMREQDVSVLSAQLSYAKEELVKAENLVKNLNQQNEDLFHQIESLKKKIETQDLALLSAGKSMEGEVDQLKTQVKIKIDKIKYLEDKLNDSAVQYDKLKERVRLDIRKIRVREKELESKLEILKKDSETLIAGRENKIIELKRKIDLLEFNYDSLQDQNELEKQNINKINEKMDRVLKVLKLASGIIESSDDETNEKTSSISKTSTGIKSA